MNIVELFFSELDTVLTEAAPAEPVEPAGPGLYSYNPDLGLKPRPDTQIHAWLSHYGNHWLLVTDLELPTNRSCKFLKVTDRGKNQYKVTELGFNRLKESFVISYSAPFD